jgi:hypothetical protein
MTAPDVLALAGQIAYALDGWEAEPCRYGDSGWVELAGPAGDRIQLRVGANWIEARGLHDQDTGPTRRWEVAGVQMKSIGFSTDKTPERMAGELRRRLLPHVAEDNRLLDAAVRRHTKARAADDLLFARAREQFPTLTWWDIGRRRREEAVSYGHGGVSIRFRLDPYEFDVYNTLTVDHLTRAELLELIRAAGHLRTRATRSCTRRQPNPGRRRNRRRRNSHARMKRTKRL